LFWLFVNQKGYLSKLFNQNLSVFLGKYSYSIFIIHPVVLNLFREYIWKIHPNFVISYPIINLFVPLVCSVLAGIVVYHLVEKPAYNYLKSKWFPVKTNADNLNNIILSSH